MYIPKHFAMEDVPTVQALIDAYDFATLVTIAEGEPFATHVPLLLDREPGPYGVLRGHIARANPQWKSFGDGEGLAIFHGPHAYVSPSWYDGAGPAVPTWNYVAIHAYGPLRIVTDEDAVVALVRRLTDLHESRFPNPWSVDSVAPDYIEHMARQIVAFEMPISRLQGKAKLSQNRPPRDRERVAEALRGTPLAEAMEAL